MLSRFASVLGRGRPSSLASTATTASSSSSSSAVSFALRSLSTSPAAPSSSSAPASAAPSSSSSSSTHVKHRVPQKRASKLLSVLRQEELQSLKKDKDYSKIQPGDSVLIERLPYMSSNEPDKIKGVVIAKTNRASDSALTLLNSEHGTPIRRRILMYSPLVQNISVIQKAFIHKGKKRVRRSKLYYLQERSPDSFTVN